MPLDVRKLIFNDQELRLAFQTFVKDQKLSALDAPIETVSIVEPDIHAFGGAKSFTATLDYVSKNPNNPHRVILDEKQILDAMIKMCRGLKIPLPRKGKKYLQQHKGSLALTIGLSESDIRDYMAVTNESIPQVPEQKAPEPKPAAKVVRRD